jgi:hypothetical protein
MTAAGAIFPSTRSVNIPIKIRRPYKAEPSNDVDLLRAGGGFPSFGDDDVNNSRDIYVFPTLKSIQLPPFTDIPAFKRVHSRYWNLFLSVATQPLFIHYSQQIPADGLCFKHLLPSRSNLR